MVIGGGIIGLNSAWFLNKAGCDVTVIERGSESDEISASYGNAGMLSPGHFIPLAAPGIISNGLKWMLDSTSPFYIKPRLNKDLISWGIKFIRSATKDHVSRSMRYLKDINLASLKLYQQLINEVSFDFEYRDSGLLMLCKTEEALMKEEKVALSARKLGLEAQILSKKELNKIEPNVHPDVIGAAIYPGDGSLSPWKFMNGLKKQLKLEGVKMIYNSEVIDFEVNKKNVKSVLTKDNMFAADEFLIAGGVWSSELVKKLKIKLPMQGGKGYNVTIENPKTKINYPAILVEAKSAVTPFPKKLRLAGTMEINGYNLSISQKRVNAIIKNSTQYYLLKDEGVFKATTPWAGLRPVSPDGLPYLGRIGEYNNISVATGHAMMGLNMGPITGKLIAEIITGKKPSFDLKLMNPKRFSKF